VFALLGDPVQHSRSPALHNAAFAACGLNAVYRAERVAAEAAGSRLRTLALQGGGGNVTVPHKQLATAFLDHASPAVRHTGAVNTFWLGPRGVHGENTDVAGFRAAASHHGVALAGRRVLVLGAGGAAAAVLLALIEEGSQVTIVNRSPERAAALAARLGELGRLRWLPQPPPESFDVVVNATSLGLHPGDPPPLPIENLPPGASLLDLVYGAAGGTTAWVAAARAAGFRAFDGAEMLLHQAAAAFAIWTGLDAPLAVMRAALHDRS
jgi:shikimate dehydrogenase